MKSRHNTKPVHAESAFPLGPIHNRNYSHDNCLYCTVSLADIDFISSEQRSLSSGASTGKLQCCDPLMSKMILLCPTKTSINSRTDRASKTRIKLVLQETFGALNCAACWVGTVSTSTLQSAMLQADKFCGSPSGTSITETTEEMLIN